MEYYNNILCVSGEELLSIMSKPKMDKLRNDGWLATIKRACYKNTALYEFNALRHDVKNELILKLGDPEEQAKKKPFKDSVKPDPKALEFFTSYLLTDGRKLPEKNIKEYCNDAAILNALITVWDKMLSRRAAMSGTMKKFFTIALKAVNDVRNEYPCTLPNSEKRLKDRFNAYKKEGYYSLISRKFCNDNSRKVSDNIENLIISLYTMPNKPYATSVHELYMQYINGEIDVCDQNTGEIFDRKDFIKNGVPVELSESTIWNYINQAMNRAIVDSKRTGNLEFNATHRPHHHRHAPFHSFSKVSLDDRDLPRKMHDGNRVKAYYAYDVTSGCIIGKAYSRDKDKALFLDCIRDMFRLIDNHGFGLPMEVEVEHHLVNKFTDSFMQAGVLFPFVRWCNPGNSQEKRAEHFNKSKKYGTEKNNQSGVGRHYAKLEANRPKLNYGEISKSYSFEKLVADDLESIKEYNNQLHPQQKKYPGLTRWQVLIKKMNPELAHVDKAVLYKYIGEKTATSITRNQYCKVKYESYQLSTPDIITRLQPNNYEVDAYWLPDSEGIINEVYLYQGDNYICKCYKILRYNESTAEQTEADHEAYTDQAKYVSKFDATIKSGKKKLAKTGIMPVKEIEAINKQVDNTLEIIQTLEKQEFESLDDILKDYDPEAIKRRAVDSL